MPRTYGHTARNLLQIATASGWCTQESFTLYVNAHLSRTGQEPITRALVGSWETGRENMPGDAIGLLVKHVAPHGRELLAALAAEVEPTVLVVERPKGLAEGEQPVVLAGGAAGAAGLLVQHIIGEEHPESEGGREHTPGELAQRMRRIEDLESLVARLRAETDEALRAKGVRAAVR
jgi:hypothetical protein